MFKKISFTMILFVVALNTKAQQSFYALDTIQKIELFFSNPLWDSMMDAEKATTDNYTFADSIKINGVLFDSIGVKYKGNSSYNPTFIKNPLHIELNQYKEQNYLGIEDIKLSNCYKDPSMIREVLAYELLSNYMIGPKANFAQVYINNNYVGLFSNIQNIDKTFCKDQFNASGNTFVKCNPIVNPGPGTKSSLKQLSPNDSSTYSNLYEIKSDYGWQDLMNLMDTVSNTPTHLDSILDIDRAIWMLAFNNALVNLDSYSGVFSQNYYLYKDNNSRFNPIVWDLNMCFGGFPFLGNSNTSMSSISLSNLPIMDLYIHNGDNYWPLLQDIYNDSTRKHQYIAHTKTIMAQMIASGQYQTLATQLQNLIDTAVQSDVNKFYTYSDFQNGLTQDVNVGSYTVPGISNLMSARNTYLSATTAFQYNSPGISNIVSPTASPSFNTQVDINATVSNANSVYLGYRFASDKKFKKVNMYDDGNHNDGTAGDGVYGAGFIALAPSVQYYIYAENNNAGTFSPEEAEFKFHTLTINCPTAVNGDVRINELMALNVSTVRDAKGAFDDWVEFSSNAKTIYIGNLFASDDASDLQKYDIPDDAYIGASENYKILWCDNEGKQTGLHANFALRNDTASVFILSDAAGNIVDSVHYSYISGDSSIGRCADFSGPFVSSSQFSIAKPTYLAENCFAAGLQDVAGIRFTLYPNPATDFLKVQASDVIHKVVIQDLHGRIKQIESEMASQQAYLNVTDLSAGIYLIRINDNAAALKFIKQ